MSYIHKAIILIRSLNNVLTKITSFISSNKDSQIAKNIRYYYLNDFENCVVVELDKSNEMEIKRV